MHSIGQLKKRLVDPTISEIPLSADELLRALLTLSPDRRLSVLDSCGATRPPARYLIAGFDPFEIIESKGSEVSIYAGGEIIRTSDCDVLRLLDDRLAEYRIENRPPTEQIAEQPVAGACIATFSYDLVHRLERLRLSSAPLIANAADVVLAFYDTLVVHDYHDGKTRIVSVAGADRIAETRTELFAAHERVEVKDELIRPVSQIFRSNMTRDEYLLKVQRIQEHIAAGDIYQANFTQQLSCRLPATSGPEDVFMRLRRDYPAPYAAFIQRSEDVVISASPERFLRMEPGTDGRYVEAWPIKGTRPRTTSAEEDERLRAELMMSEKDRAENVMIVDLLRNDLGRVCRYGSVEVKELCALEEHPTLFHLVSKVGGVLRDDVTVGDLLRATFPCGSITGAPKIRAMEIIAETETAPRGLSMGAIGYFSFAGALDLSVAIRTAVVRNGEARFNVGGGIVADSSPTLEYEESLVKARALLGALGAGPLG